MQVIVTITCLFGALWERQPLHLSSPHAQEVVHGVYVLLLTLLWLCRAQPPCELVVVGALLPVMQDDGLKLTCETTKTRVHAMQASCSVTFYAIMTGL